MPVRLDVLSSEETPPCRDIRSPQVGLAPRNPTLLSHVGCRCRVTPCGPT